MANIKIIQRRQLDAEGRYNYCPDCARKLKAEGKEIKDNLPPLFSVVTAEYMPQCDKEYISEHFECTRCGNKNITLETFYNAYCGKTTRG